MKTLIHIRGQFETLKGPFELQANYSTEDEMFVSINIYPSMLFGFPTDRLRLMRSKNGMYFQRTYRSTDNKLRIENYDNPFTKFAIEKMYELLKEHNKN